MNGSKPSAEQRRVTVSLPQRLSGPVNAPFPHEPPKWGQKWGQSPSEKGTVPILSPLRMVQGGEGRVSLSRSQASA